MSNENVAWVDSLWVTRKESIILRDGDDVISREISVGMSVKSERGIPSSVLHEKLNTALTKLIEDEKDNWLSAELIKRERDHVKESISGMNSLITGKYKVTEPVNKPVNNSKSQISLML